METEQRFGARAVVDQPVERREEGGAVGNGGVVRLRVLLPRPVSSLPDAERPEPLLVAEAFRLGEAQLLPLGRIPALGEVEHPMTTAAADDGDLAARAEDLEHHVDAARAPPTVLLPRVRIL